MKSFGGSINGIGRGGGGGQPPFQCNTINAHEAPRQMRRAPSRYTSRAVRCARGANGKTPLVNLEAPPDPASPPPSQRSRSSGVMHVTPELEVLGSNPGGIGKQCPRL